MNNQENNNKHVTIDDLAAMMKKGFDGVDEKLKGVDKKFDGVDEQFKRIAQTLDRVVTVVVNTQEDMKEMKIDVKQSRENIDVLVTNQDWMIGVLTRIDQERIMGSRSIQEMKSTIDKLEKRVQKLELARA